MGWLAHGIFLSLPSGGIARVDALPMKGRGGLSPPALGSPAAQKRSFVFDTGETNDLFCGPVDRLSRGPIYPLTSTEQFCPGTWEHLQPKSQHWGIREGRKGGRKRKGWVL